MKTKNVIWIVLIAAITLGIGFYLSPHTQGHAVAVRRGGHLEIWYCPMHPWILYNHPGHCPICGMDLVKKEDAPQEKTSGIEGYTTISVTAQRQQLIGLRTQVVGIKPLVKLIRTFGTISSDLDLYKIQNEFIDSYMTYVKVHRDYKKINDRRDPWGTHRDIQTSLLESQDKLLKLGLSKGEIDKLQNVSWNQMSRQPKLLMFNDSRSYWVMAQIFEQDYRFVHEGQEVEVSIPALHEKIKGAIRSVGGFIDPTSRSVTVLIELKDPSEQLAANMQVDITIPVKLGDGILVPRESVMDTGLRKIVFVCAAENAFEPREIQTGWETDDGYEVRSGLKEGMRIVVSGNFLLDSESRVKASQEQGVSHG
jgi:Cu(I)/Ag(I) efflux system membrane fusion protein